jgi:hypothetical protein
MGLCKEERIFFPRLLSVFFCLPGVPDNPVREGIVRRRRAMGPCKDEGICFPIRAMMTLL